MKGVVLILLGLLPYGVGAQAKAPGDSIHRPRTIEVASKFEEFTGRRGSLFTRTSEKIGEIRAENFRDLTISIATVTEAGPSATTVSALVLGSRYSIPVG